MGSCISSLAAEEDGDNSGSSRSSITTPSKANVISINGDLHEYQVPITASEVLQAEVNPSSSSSSSLSSNLLFICSSDKLFFDDFIPPLESAELLQVGQIYFVLPTSKLEYPLTASDMASMAAKASAALLLNSDTGLKKKGRNRRRKKIRVSPVLDVDNMGAANGDFGVGRGFDGYYYNGSEMKRIDNIYKKWTSSSIAGASANEEGGQFMRSGSIRKLQRSASRRAKFVYKSFKAKLSTIYENEGSVLA